MKILRVWLLLLLAVLLPIRGAMGAAMPCAADDYGSVEQVMASGHGHHHDDATHVAEADEHAAGGASHHHHEHGTGDKCNLCSACCSSTPMVTIYAPTFAPVDSSAVSFPSLHVSAPSFLSDGQERPPRSI